MHILYLDDSGSVKNRDDRYLILAGLAVHENDPYYLSKQLHELACEAWPDAPHGLEFRGADIMGGKKHWRGIGRADRSRFYERALRILSNTKRVRIFAAAIDKAELSPDDPMEYAFEALVNRFDRYLGRLHKAGNTQRGLIVFDESSYETSIQVLARDFREHGHRWGNLHNIADVPLFVDSRATRMVQFADMVAYAVRKYFERGDSQLFDIFSHRLDAEGGVTHGLVHYSSLGAACRCLACVQKRARMAAAV